MCQNKVKSLLSQSWHSAGLWDKNSCSLLSLGSCYESLKELQDLPCLLMLLMSSLPETLFLPFFCFASLPPAAAAAAKSLQSCPTLCDPIDASPPGSPVPGILQARTLEWVAISFSNAWKWKGKVKSPSRVRLLVTPWTAAHQAPPSMGFSRQQYWSGSPLPSPSLTPTQL